MKCVVEPSLHEGSSTILARHRGHVCSRSNHFVTQISQNMCWHSSNTGVLNSSWQMEHWLPAVAICSFEGVVPIVCEQETLMSQRNCTVSKRLCGLNFEKKSYAIVPNIDLVYRNFSVTSSKRLNFGLLGTLVETIQDQKWKIQFYKRSKNI